MCGRPSRTQCGTSCTHCAGCTSVSNAAGSAQLPLPLTARRRCAPWPHLALPLGRLPRRALARGAAHMVLAGPQVLAALGAEGQLSAVAALLARAAHVGRRAVVHLQAPELSEAAVAACGAGGGRRGGGRAVRAAERGDMAAGTRPTTSWLARPAAGTCGAGAAAARRQPVRTWMGAVEPAGGREGAGGAGAGEAGSARANRAARGPAAPYKHSPVGIGPSDHPRQLLCRLGRRRPLLRHTEPRAGPGGRSKARADDEERLEGPASGSRPSFRALATCGPALATALPRGASKRLMVRCKCGWASPRARGVATSGWPPQQPKHMAHRAASQSPSRVPE